MKKIERHFRPVKSLPSILWWSLTTFVIVAGTQARAAQAGVDPSFDARPGGVVRALAVQSDGQIVVGGDFYAIGGLQHRGIARLNADGSGDGSFDPGTGTDGSVNVVALQPNGKLFIGGEFSTVNGLSRYDVARLNADGTLDEAFNPITELAGGSVHALAVQPDGKVLVGGGFANPKLRAQILRLNADGTLDALFVPNPGVHFLNVHSIALQPDGKVLVGGSSFLGVTNLVRLNADGSLDSRFKPDARAIGVVESVIVQADARVVVACSSGTNLVLRLDASGNLDTGFRAIVGGFYPRVYSVYVQPDAKVLIGGNFERVEGVKQAGLARLKADGSLDESFIPGGVGGLVLSIAPQASGEVLIGGAYPYSPDGFALRMFADFPWIKAQPRGGDAVAGQNVTFGVEATGGLPLTYQWFKDGSGIPGATNSVLTLTAVQKADQGSFSVLVSNAFGSVMSSNATLQVDRPPVADASATVPVVISRNGVDALVTFDASRSFDPDGDELWYEWYGIDARLVNPGMTFGFPVDDPIIIPFAAGDGPVARRVVPVGTYQIQLVVLDSKSYARAEVFTLEVLTTAQALKRLIDWVGAMADRSRPLRATLDAAVASLARGNSLSAANQLQAFQNQVQAQVFPSNPTLARTLVEAVQEIINSLNR